MKGNQEKQKKAKSSPGKDDGAASRRKRQQNSRGRKMNVDSGKKSYNKQPTPANYDVIPLAESSKGRGTITFYHGLLIVLLATLFMVTTAASSFVITSSFSVSDVFVHAEGTPTDVYPGGINLNAPRTKPTLCSDGETYGYSDWNSLRSAVMEINSIAASFPVVDDSNWVVDDYGVAAPYLPPPPPQPFVICPGITLKGRNRKGAIFVDSEDVVIECDSCTVDLGGTHFSFGPNAKGVVIRGITFMGAKSSSLTFHHHGAEATFEDCIWIGNSGLNNAGAVADLNSTSSVSFFRCEISDSKQMPRAVGYGGPGVSSSLTIRN